MSRNMIRRNPFQVFAPFIDFANDWEGFFGPADGSRSGRTMKPAMDIAESEEELTISVELPGLKKEDVKLSIENGDLLVETSGQFDGSDWRMLRVVADGDHFRTYVDTELAAHGHGDPGPVGPVGLRLNGTGSVRVAYVRAVPLRSNTN